MTNNQITILIGAAVVAGIVAANAICVYIEDHRTDVAVRLISGSEDIQRDQNWIAAQKQGRSIFAVPANALSTALDEIKGLHVAARKELEQAIAAHKVTLGYIEVWDPDRPIGSGASFQMGTTEAGGWFNQTVRLSNRAQRVYVVRPVRDQTVEECKPFENCQNVCGPDTTFKSTACRLTITIWTPNTSVGIRFVEGVVITSQPGFMELERKAHADPYAIRHMSIL